MDGVLRDMPFTFVYLDRKLCIIMLTRRDMESPVYCLDEIHWKKLINLEFPTNFLDWMLTDQFAKYTDVLKHVRVRSLIYT